MRWPDEAIEDYKKETGKDLRKVANAKDVAAKMLRAFPALHQLENHSDIWADLQFIEAEAVIGTMLILMRTHGVPSLALVRLTTSESVPSARCAVEAGSVARGLDAPDPPD